MATQSIMVLVFLCFSLNFLPPILGNPATTNANHQNDSKSNSTHIKSKSPLSNEFPHFASLDPAGAVNLFWKFDNETITFQVHATTTGWAGIGFSPNGGMANADMVVFWTDGSGKGVISDRYGSENGFPKEDTQQDYTLVDATKNDTHLIVTFSRKRITCDPQDWPLKEGTTRVIYALNNAVPESKDSFRKHTTRGSKSVHIFDEKPGPEKTLPEKDAKPIDIRVNKVHIPDNETTTYWCEVMRVPKFSKKRHMIKADPIIDPKNTDIVHHILAYICTKDMSEYVGKGHVCFGKEKEMNEIAQHCMFSVLSVWAVGGESTTFPDNIGFPIYNDATDLFVMMEIHYENSELKKGKIDTSGMRIWVTEKLRPIDAGQAMFGIPVGADEQVIPPGVKEFTYYGYCTAECTAGFPKDGVKILGGLLHTHLTGRKIRVSHFRDGKELPPLIADEHYDFNYQDIRRLKEPSILLPGDELVVECVYETLDRSKTTFSGHSTHDEMCLAFLDYYPAAYRGFSCMSSSDKETLYQQFGIDFAPFNESHPLRSSVIMPDGKEKDLDEYFEQDFHFDWTQQKIDQLQKDIRDVNHTAFCMLQGLNQSKFEIKTNASGKMEGMIISEQAGYPKTTQPYVEADICGNKKGPVSMNNEDNRSNRNNQAISSTGIREKNAGRKTGFDLSVIIISISIAFYGT